jgi:hypothetical protein
VISHADTEASSDPPQHERYDKSGPAEEKQRRDRADVKCRHEGGGQINSLGKRFVSPEGAHFVILTLFREFNAVMTLDEDEVQTGAGVL